MKTSEKWMWLYKVVRSILFTSAVSIVFLFVCVYVLLSIPGFQKGITNIAENELSNFLGGEIKIESVYFYPFNEVVVNNVEVYEKDTHNSCIKIDKIGAGISIWNLLRHGKIILTYAELIGLDGNVRQYEKNGPLNIQFIIDAFSPKDKNKPPTKFDLMIHNVVIRKSRIAFDRLWCERSKSEVFDVNHITLSNINADVDLPKLKNDDINIDLRKLAFNLSDKLKVEKLGANLQIANNDIKIKNFELNLPSTEVALSEIDLPLGKYGNVEKFMQTGNLDIKVNIHNAMPSEFALFLPALSSFSQNFDINFDIFGNLNNLCLKELSIKERDSDFKLLTNTIFLSIKEKLPENVKVEGFKLTSDPNFNHSIAKSFSKEIPGRVEDVINNIGSLLVELDCSGNFTKKAFDADLKISSGLGDINLQALLEEINRTEKLEISLNSENLNLGDLLNTRSVGKLSLDLNGIIDFDSRFFDKNFLAKSITSTSNDKLKRIENISHLFSKVDVNINIPDIEINERELNDIQILLTKNNNDAELHLNSADESCDLDIIAQYILLGEETQLISEGTITNLNLKKLGISTGIGDLQFSGIYDIILRGDSFETLTGEFNLDDFNLTKEKAGVEKNLRMNHLWVTADIDEENHRNYGLESDWLRGTISGDFSPNSLPGGVKKMIAEAYPTLIKNENINDIVYNDNLDFKFEVFKGGDWSEFFNLPLKLLHDAEISGNLDCKEEKLNIDIKAPFIQQGKDKLIQHTSLSYHLNKTDGSGNFYSSIPTKKGILDLNLILNSSPENFGLLCQFNPNSQGAFYGDFALNGEIKNSLNPSGEEVLVKVLPSSIFLNGAEWNVGGSSINYVNGIINVDNFSISHENQYLSIAGFASKSNADEVIINLQDIDLDYVFETLNIDVAQFGGRATGVAIGKGVLSKDFEAFTRDLKVKNLSYNKCVLGDGDLKGTFNMLSKRVGIYADVKEDNKFVANIDGGIWVGKDSLSFAFDADKVKIGFLQPFMKAFTSHVEGRASGNALLYGTFKDVNMKGKLFADTIALKVDYTNVTYCGSDSVNIVPGRIDIPRFRLYDTEGNAAYLSGILEHDYFHHPEFDFRITDCHNLMLYDTNPSINPVWFGKVYGSGTGRIVGNDDIVKIIADMTTDVGTDFTFALEDSKEAVSYQFLTFIDSQKEKQKAEELVSISETDEIIQNFNKKNQEDSQSTSVFSMDLRVMLTNAAKMNLIMDPVAGDKITAHGGGPINITYNSETDAMRMYGKYTLTEGIYNFSLQDLILKDFIIKEGSSISFNGDPMDANLNIRGAYRVNTNLTDLDASFATDKDVNRVNVPVDAMLLVTGELEQPDIKFDIELPTLNSETEQKVRSIISSEDMMNTQMIYLLALNRFYTPDYGNNTGKSGGEWASVASSTLSSQLQNILGQITDKVTVAPSLRSDKGDFSDLQVDVALSSRLFNNRLIINGNLGYRDPSTSSSTFIGDFDIEYLLHKNGNFRLKAYNHFNDQNYYLKSALTTQGLGLIYRKDFDRLFRKKKKLKSSLPLTE